MHITIHIGLIYPLATRLALPGISSVAPVSNAIDSDMLLPACASVAETLGSAVATLMFSRYANPTEYYLKELLCICRYNIFTSFTYLSSNIPHTFI